MLDKGANIYATNFKGESALSIATESKLRCLGATKLVLYKDIENKMAGVRALVDASSQGNAESLKALLDNSSDLMKVLEQESQDRFSSNRQDIWEEFNLYKSVSYADLQKNIKNAFYNAAQNGYVDVVKTWLDKTPFHILVGDGYDHWWFWKGNPLYAAVKNGHADVVKILLDKGGFGKDKEPELYDFDNVTALSVAAAGGHVEIIKMLLNKGADINELSDESGTTPLMSASSHGRIDAVKILIEKGANVRAVDKHGNTAFVYAAENGNVEIVKYFLENGCVDLDKALYAANRPEVVKILLEKATDISKQTLNNALRNAAKNDQPEIIKILLEYGANINVPDSQGMTPLHVAAETYNDEMIKFLLQHSANKFARTNDGQTASEIARNNRCKSIVAYLENFKQPLPKGFTLSPQNSVLIRLWLPKINDKQTSYPNVMFKQLFHLGDGNNTNIGHISISIHDSEGGTYVSHWPGDDVQFFTSVPGENRTLQYDIEEGERSVPDTQVILYSLDTNKMLTLLKQIGEKAPWFMFADKAKDTKKGGNKAYNCSSYVYELLVEGGLLNHLLSKKENLHGIITPIEVAELAKKAQEVESILYPETKSFFEESLQKYKNELLEKSRNINDASESVKKFIETNPDYHLLYSKFYPEEYKTVLHEVYVNIEKSYGNALLALITSSNFYGQQEFMKIMDDLLDRGATLLAKNKKGYNALHCAIKKNNYNCVAKLLARFPLAINSEIDYTISDNKDNDANETLNVNGYSDARLFSVKGENKRAPLTPLDLAIDKNNEPIIKLLIEKGAVTKSRWGQIAPWSNLTPS